MNRRGFTAIEICIVLSILSVMVPISFLVWRSFESQYRDALAHAQAAAQMRGLSEELRRDLLTMKWENATSVALVGPGACSRVEYAVDPTGIVFRRGAPGCGDPRPVARDIASLKAIPEGVEVVFSTRTGAPQPFTTSFVFGAPR
jgi:prepilin-type N-terminal cleavage/methylation domain-containing protein